jgi:hypothetical protein
MNKLKLASGVILLFLVGALAGSLTTGIYFKQRITRFETGGPPMPVRVRMLLDRFSEELDLTDTQREELEKVVRETQEKIFALGREIFPEIEKINEQGLTLIKENLNDDQKKKLDIIYQKMEEFRSRLPIPPDLSRKIRERVFARMKDRLKLTPEQEKKIQTIMDSGEKEREKIMERHRGREPRDLFSLRREIRENERSMERKLSKIITREQVEEYRKIRKEERRAMREKSFHPGPH